MIDSTFFSSEDNSSESSESRQRCFKDIVDVIVNNIFPDISKNISYKILKKIGQGSYGKVYLAENRQTHDKFALKRLNLEKERAKSGDITPFMKNLSNEINSLKLIDVKCRYVVKYLGLYYQYPFIDIMTEYIPGYNLEDTIYTLSDLLETTEEIYEITLHFAIHILKALETIHSKNIIHGDIKPENIQVLNKSYISSIDDLRISSEYLPVLIDFGLSCKVDSESSNASVGSPHYTAPEVILNKKRYLKSDIWSLGITILYILGIKPWENKTSIRGLLNEIINPLSTPTLKSGNKHLDHIVNKMLTWDHHDRPTATELLKYITQVNK